MPRQSDARVAGGLFGLTGSNDAHRQAAAGRERGHLADPHRPSGLQIEAETTQDRGGDRPDLELAEAHPDADPGAGAEGDVGALWELRPLLGREALGLERWGIFEHVRKPVGGPWGVVDRELDGDPVATELELDFGAAGADPRGRIEAE